MIKRILLSLGLYISTISHADIVYEIGSLSGFLLGSSTSSSYDNWLSHVTEGIISEGYNDYGPEWLDVQTNGFGNYTHLGEDSPTLEYWENIFSGFISGDTTVVDSLLQDSISSFFYEFVILHDTLENQTFHMLREKIDTSIVDFNQPENNLDDIVGGFRNSWGIYIINPNAEREQVVVQVPHPCDDFIAPYIALDLFLETNAYALMMNGAGREVLWTEIGNYSNEKSLSDPSRHPHTIFQKFQEVLIHPLIDHQTHWPLVFAVHSFDNSTHAPRKSVILAAGAHNPLTNKPIRDISEDHFDIINFTEEFPISSGQFNNSEPLHVTDYYEAFFDNNFVYDNGSDQFPITLATELRGPNNGVQMIDLQSQISGYSVYEPWIHVELDEKPMLFDSSGISDNDTYMNGFYPTGIDNFSMIREYYRPFIDATEAYLTHWESSTDNTPPDSIEFIRAYNMDNSNEVYLTWAPTDDTNFKSFQIEADIDTLFNSLISFDFEDYDKLQYMHQDNQILTGLNNTQQLWFRIRATDYFDNTGPWSQMATNLLPGHEMPDTLLDFNYVNNINSIVDEDIDQESYAIDSIDTFPGNSSTFVLFGNSWKSIAIQPFVIDSSTTLQIFTKIDSISEIQAIGFSNGLEEIRYSFSGLEMLNMEEWIPVYQGSSEVGVWNSYRLPLGNDWLAWHDTLSSINEIYFINDHDDTSSPPGSIHFSMLRDITSDLPIIPKITIEYEMSNVRNQNHSQIVSVSFNSVIQDTDSYSFNYQWEFGDGNTSNEPNPQHDYIIEDDHGYTVILTVEDETGMQDWATTVIEVDHGSSTFPITINFVGDIMMGRRFEESDGIIQTQGVQALFEPTHELFGLAADMSVANLEIPLSDQGYPHPTKGIIFRCSPENVSGLVYGGIDVVSLANNHILDYMEPAMIQTQNILNEAGILHSGSGMNSYEAYLPAIKSIKGQVIAFLASSDRTGQYNNYQPYLNAGENKSGFAYMTPYYLRQQIQSVDNVADIIVIEMHAGSEYSYSPGSDYDSFYFPDEFDDLRTNPASLIGFEMIPRYGTEINDYSWRLDRPKMWDRAIRHFAIDEGADLVIVHHPHIIQGLEIYEGKLIAHSLGNFIFDLNYPETYPSMILNSEADDSGFTNFFIDPIYIDDYLTVPAQGELGNYILNHVAMLSKELDTYVHVDKDNQRAYVILDTITMPIETIQYDTWIMNSKSTILNNENYFQSEPVPISEAGSISKLVNGHYSVTHFRLGREKVWMNNFEYEGSSLWDLNSNNEMIQDSIFRRGNNGLLHIRYPDSPDNIITNLEERIPFDNQYQHTIHGFIKTENANNVTLEIKCSAGRSGESLFTISIDDSISGSSTWQKYWGDVPNNQDAEFFDIRMNSDIPDSSIAYSWFDDVGLIEWDTLELISEYPILIPHPNNYDYIQFFYNQEQLDTFAMELENSIIGPLGPLNAEPRVTQNILSVPDYFHFYDESTGPIGDRTWTLNSEIIGLGKAPSFFCEEPGVYEITLNVNGIGQDEDNQTITIIALPPESNQHQTGDINGDESIDMIDLLLCVNQILGIYILQPLGFLAADIDNNGIIDVYDILRISELLN
ncbi:MAG: CapA family protein [Candidatus Neomarinimicrobiota bacterium]